MSDTNDISTENYAFFDIDGTLITIKSMFSFQDFMRKHASKYKGLIGVLRYKYEDFRYYMYRVMNTDRAIVNKYYYQNFSGLPANEVQGLVDQWNENILKDDNLIIQETVKRLQEHKRNGYKIVAVSGSFVELLKPLMDKLGIDICLATNLEQKEGIFTGNIIPPQTIGKGKAVAIQNFLTSNDANLNQCYAYGDHHSDIPMLETVGNPVVVAGDKTLMDYGKEKNWPVIHPVVAG